METSNKPQLAEAQTELPKDGPTITYEDPKAKKVDFIVNPKAKYYLVKANGQILESF